MLLDRYISKTDIYQRSECHHLYKTKFILIYEFLSLVFPTLSSMENSFLGIWSPGLRNNVVEQR